MPAVPQHPRLRRGKNQRLAVPYLRLEPLENRELFSAQPPLIADAAPYSAQFVSAVFRQALDRPVDPASLNSFVTLLDQGQPTATIAADVVNSDEYAARIVQTAYQQCLGRAADPVALSICVNGLHSGTTDEQLIAMLAASNEFYARAGGNNVAWIQAAYGAILDRPALNSDVGYWLAQLNAGRSRLAVANCLATSLEHAVLVVKADFARYLPQTFSEAAYESVATRITSGQATDEAVVIGILATNAYYEAQTGVSPSIVPMPSLLAGWDTRFAQIQAAAAQSNAPVVFLGDSLTGGWEGLGQSPWSQYFAPLNAFNAGIGGDTTQGVLWRIEHDQLSGLSPKLVVLMIGVNDFGMGATPQEVADGVTVDVEALRQQLPSSKILVLSVLPAVVATTPPWNLMPQIQATNNIISGLADGHSVFYQNLWPEFLNPDGSSNTALHISDGLHLNQAGYTVLAQAISPTVNQLLSQP